MRGERSLELFQETANSTHNMTCCKLEAKFKFFPAELVVHVLGQVLKTLDNNRNLDQHMIHVDAYAALLLS